MIIAVIGGGSVYTLELARALIFSGLPEGELRLYDLDKQRLERVFCYVQRFLQRQKSSWRAQPKRSLRSVLKGTDVVITQFRVGGNKARLQDERVARRHRVVAQETVGVGGWASALRHLPVLFRICETIAAVAPCARLLNFTNPSGILTEGAIRYGQQRGAIGLCNIPLTVRQALAAQLGVPAAILQMQWFGLNHLSFVNSVKAGRREFLPLLLKEKRFPNAKLFRKKDVSFLKVLPSPYLQYYLYSEKAKQRQKKQLRAEEVLKIEDQIHKELSQSTVLPPSLKKRGGAGYAQAAIELLESLATHSNKVHILNVPNGKALPFLEENAVIECACNVGRKVTTLPLPAVPLILQPLLQTVKGYERLTIEAAWQGSQELAIWALSQNPLIPDITRAEKIAHALFKKQRDALGYLQ